jgi:hypothetical protein
MHATTLSYHGCPAGLFSALQHIQAHKKPVTILNSMNLGEERTMSCGFVVLRREKTNISRPNE